MSKHKHDFNCGSGEGTGTLGMRPAILGWGPGSSARCGRAPQRRRSGASLFQALCGRSNFGPQPEAWPEQQRQLPAQGALRLVIELVIQDDEEEAA